MASEQQESFLDKKPFIRCVSHAHDELQSFRSCLRWMFVEQSDRWRAVLSWAFFILLAVGVPCLSHFVLSCRGCDAKHRRPYDVVVQPSLTVIAALSFFCLSRFVKKYGLRRFLFLDKLCDESEIVRKCYMTQLNKSFKLLSIFVVPCFIAESAYKIWWYASGASGIPFLGNVFVSDAIACILELCSWIYRTSVFFLVCVLFRIICYLQILSLEDFTKVFHEESDVALVLKEHLRIRRHLKIISHRYRAFILLALVFVTVSQFAALLITTKTHSDVSIFRAGELALCSVSLVTGLFICLRSAAKITHKALAITSHAAKWHVCATIDSFDGTDNERPITPSGSRRRRFLADGESDHESCDDEDEYETKIVLPHAQTISFQKRQALVSYFENNRAGITVFGFILDRTWLHMIFGIQLSLVLWLLGKTVGI